MRAHRCCCKHVLINQWQFFNEIFLFFVRIFETFFGTRKILIFGNCFIFIRVSSKFFGNSRDACENLTAIALWVCNSRARTLAANWHKLLQRAKVDCAYAKPSFCSIQRTFLSFIELTISGIIHAKGRTIFERS